MRVHIKFREVLGNAQNKCTKVRKILRENVRTRVDPSLSGNGAQETWARCVFLGFLMRKKFSPPTE